MRKVISFVLCFCFLIGVSSCGEVDSLSKTEKTIAVKYDSAEEMACKEYIDYTKVTYNSNSDVVLAVENKKVDFGILDEIKLNSYIDAGRNIQPKEKCEYSLDYCAYFSRNSETLQKSFNDAIKGIKENGTLDKIKSTHIKGGVYKVRSDNNKNGTLTMLCDPSFENRVYTDNNGNIVGLDVDIAREICGYLGYELEIVTADFDDLFVKLDKGEGDFIISACEVNEERAGYYLLSDTYFTSNYYLIERK